MIGVKTVRLTEQNMEVLKDVADDVFDDRIDPERLRTYLAEKTHLLIVATMDNRVVGQAAAYIHHHPDQPSDLYIDNLGVTPAVQRRGIARRLIRELLAWGTSLGCAQAWIVTDNENAAARELYVSLGAEKRNILMFSYALSQNAAG